MLWFVDIFNCEYHYLGWTYLIEKNIGSSLPSVLSQLSTISETVEQVNNTYNTVRDKTHSQLLSDAASVAELIESVSQYTNEEQNVIEEATR